MFRNMQLKIILIFFLVGIILIGGLGITFITNMNNINMQVINGQITELEQITNIIKQIQNNTVAIIIISGIVFSIVGILLAIFLSKFVIYPINKLIKSAEKITEEDKNKKRNKKNNDMGELENVFGAMTTELKEKLREVSTQKNQIETILLHMTDGIIAFNMEGEIILINPAAKKFLSIRPLSLKLLYSKFIVSPHYTVFP